MVEASQNDAARCSLVDKILATSLLTKSTKYQTAKKLVTVPTVCLPSTIFFYLHFLYLIWHVI